MPPSPPLPSVSVPLDASGEQASFYIPLIGDPKTSGTMFAGMQHVWRTIDNGGPESYLQSCPEFTTSGDDP